MTATSRRFRYDWDTGLRSRIKLASESVESHSITDDVNGKGQRNRAFKAHNSVTMDVRVSSENALARHFFSVGSAMLGLNKKDISDKSRAQRFRDNFKWGPGRLAFLYLQIKDHPMLRGLDVQYKPKHLLWTFFFLSCYATERRICVALNADRKTVRKVTWPTIIAISALASEFVSTGPATFLTFHHLSYLTFFRF